MKELPLASKLLKNTNETPVKRNDFPIVAIGTSAGGLEAMDVFFENMPVDTGLAFIVIQHLDPNYPGLLPELLQRKTKMTVLQTTDNLEVKPNHVYVIPPNKNIRISHGFLFLLDRIEALSLHLPIDILFKSLALDKKENSIGIILSGMGSDGSLGCKAIKENNGLVVVQEPRTAKFDSMPLSAIEAVNADIVATVNEIPQLVLALLKSKPTLNTDPELDSNYKANLETIIHLLQEQTGHDFLLYKKNTLMRRIERRKGIHKIDTIEKYVLFLKENPKEIELLFKELLIGVTNFFRDSAVWDKLKQDVLPELVKNVPDGYVLKAWISACSTGEEAYSLAIIFKEVAENSSKNISLQIFASDLDIEAIEKARKGIFTNLDLDVSPERIKKFFITEKQGFKINASIREMLVFAPHNVIKDPPFTKLDLLMCRNMLIYMEPELQKKLIELFNYSLLPNGIMVLGSAETLGQQNEGFEVLNSKLKIFKRTPKGISYDYIGFPSSFSKSLKANSKIALETKKEGNIQEIADQILLQQYSPASVLVNYKGDIIYITGRTGKYLEPVAGKANWNIHVMAREGLRHELPNAFRKVIQTDEVVFLKNVKIGTETDANYVNVTIQHLDAPETVKGMVMLVFNDVPEPIVIENTNLKNGKQLNSSAQKTLELKLKQNEEDLKNSREEMQASQEELKSTNEELQSTNEELQSTNEELTTSKEEMQSLNEELQTVNAELQSKLVDFEQANNDMKNLLNSTKIATLFLDKELNIRRFTDSATTIFKLRTADIGRPITDLVSDLNYPEMRNHAKNVIQNLSSIENTIPTKDGRWYDVRIMPYRTLDDRIDGLVLTFSDITKPKQAEIRMVNENRYRRLFESAKDGILILDAETGKIIDVNPFLIEILGYSHEQFVEKTIWEIGVLQDIVANKDKFSELQKKKFVRYENLPLETFDGRKINVEFISNEYLVNDKKVIQCIIRDVSEHKLIENELATYKNKFHNLFDSIQDGVFFLDENSGKITEINPFLIALLETTKDELIKKPIWETEYFKDTIANKEAFEGLKNKEILRFTNVSLSISTSKTILVDFVYNMYVYENERVIQCVIHVL